MRGLALAFALLIAAPVGAQFSFLGITNSLVDFVLEQISVPGELTLAARTVEEGEDGALDIVGLTVGDAEGVWMEIDRLSLRWNASRILSGELEIARLEARGVDVRRAPNQTAVDVEVNEGSALAESDGDLFDWPRSPITARVERLALTDVTIAPGVLAAQGLAFDAEGAARDEGDEQAVRLTVVRTDAVAGRIDFDFLRDFSTNALNFSLDAEEAAGGLVAALADFPDTSATRVTLRGQGPLDDWDLNFDAESEEVFAAAGRARVAARGPLAATADFQLTPGAALDPTLAAALSPAARLDVDVAEDAGGVIRIRRGALTARDLDLTAEGEFNRATTESDLAIRLEAREGLADLVDGLAFRRFGFDGRLTGPLEAFSASGEITLNDLKTAPADVGAARLSASIDRTGDDIAARLVGDVEAMQIDRIGADLLGTAEIGLDAVYGDDALRLNSFRVAAIPLTLTASGAADLGAETAEMSYTLSAPAIGPLAAAYAIDAEGAIAAEGGLSGPFAAPRLVGEAALNGLVYEGEAYGAAQLRHDAVLDASPSGMAAFRADGSRFGPLAFDGAFALDADLLTLSDMVAEGLGARIDGALEVDLATNLISGLVTLDAPDLSQAAAAASLPLAGGASGRVALAPKDGAQGAKVDLALNDIEGGDVALEEGRLTATLRDLLAAPAVEGVLEARGARALDNRVGALRLSGSAASLTDADPLFDLILSAEDLRSAGARIGAVDGSAAGALSAIELDVTASAAVAAGAAIARASVKGDVTGAATDAPAVDLSFDVNGIAAEGVALRTATGDLVGGLDAVLLRATARDLSAGAARVAGMRIDVSAKNPLGDDPGLTAGLRAEGIEAGGAVMSVADVTAQGRLSALNAALEAEGALEDGRPVRLSATANGAFAGAAQRATVSSFTFSAAEAEIALRAPLQVAISNGATRLSAIDLALPGGGMTGEASLYSNGASGDLFLSLSDLRPIANIADLPLEEGALEVVAVFDTRPSTASATARIDASDLRFADIVADIGALALSTDIDWDGRRVATDTTLSGPFGAPVAIAASTALRPSGGPAPTAPEDGALAGYVRWSGDIGELWPLVPAPGNVLDGATEVDLTLGGTLRAPQFGGEVSIKNGRYENLDVGAILVDLNLASRVEPDGGFALDLSAHDGAERPVTATVAFADGAVDAKVEANGAVLVRRDDVTAEVSLDVIAKGPIAGPAVTGRIGIDRAEVRLVAATPPGVADLGPVRVKGAPPEEEEARAGGDVTLNLSIEGPRDIYVRGRGLDSEWAIDLDVTGTAASPRIDGAIQKRRGQLSLLGAPLKLERGEIRFFNRPSPDPTLDILLEREKDGVTGGIAVTGQASEPQINFVSRPALPEDEVLPRILFGQSSQSLSPSQAISLAVGVATLLDGSGGTTDSVRGAVGLDVLRVEEGEDGPSVAIGSNVADGVFVGAKQPIDGGSASVQVEVEVFDDFTIDSETGQDVGTSIGLNWKRDF